MLYSLFGDFSEGGEPRGRATFDGKSLEEFLRTDYDYFDLEKSGPNGMRARNPQDFIIDSFTGSGPRAQFFAPLRNAGLDTQDYQFYADKAGIKNVNSRSDLDQIITAFEEDRRKPEKMSEEMVPQPVMQQPMTMAGKYLGFF
jgi:hypothetical protein